MTEKKLTLKSESARVKRAEHLRFVALRVRAGFAHAQWYFVPGSVTLFVFGFENSRCLNVLEGLMN